MKPIIFLAFLTCMRICTIAQTQADLTATSGNDYQKADAELNRIYRQILKDYKEDTAFIINLKASQRIWIQFRDAELKMKYPVRKPGFYGSVHPMCILMYLAELTQARINTLKIWTEGIEEGDVCAGSVKRKE